MTDRPTIFLSAGEVSGDLHGAHLARAIRAACPEVRLIGVGGPRMAEAGVEILADVTAHSAIGLTEQLPHLLPVARAFKLAGASLAALRPRAVVLIDYQGANMGLAKTARRLGLKTVYYITPQEWLWGFKRGPAKVAAGVDHLLAVFAREAEVYQAAGARVTFVGHPLVDIHARRTRAAARAALGLREDEQVLTLLPGSRAQEVAQLLPVFLEAGRRVKAQLPELTLLLPAASAGLRQAIEPVAAAAGVAVRLLDGQGAEALAAADVALAASGTVTLEAAILDVPCVAAYRVSRLTAFLAKRLLKVRHVTLPNIVEGDEVIPEFLQERVDPALLAPAVVELLADPEARQRQIRGMARVREKLGGPGALERAARAILADAGVAPGMLVTAQP